MPLEDLQLLIYEKIVEIENRVEYNPSVPLEEAINRRYPISRSLEDYLVKFPTLESNFKKGMKFLEIGIGEGIAFNSIINNYNLIGTATNFELANETNVIKAVASNLPFNDNYFDLVISVHSITWEPNQKKSILEVLRVLKPGGKAFINLVKFSEITSLWFGDDFWNSFSKKEFQMLYEFDENDYTIPDFSIRSEIPKDYNGRLCRNYYLEISK